MFLKGSLILPNNDVQNTPSHKSMYYKTPKFIGSQQCSSNLLKNLISSHSHIPVSPLPPKSPRAFPPNLICQQMDSVSGFRKLASNITWMVRKGSIIKGSLMIKHFLQEEISQAFCVKWDFMHLSVFHLCLCAFLFHLCGDSLYHFSQSLIFFPYGCNCFFVISP